MAATEKKNLWLWASGYGSDTPPPLRSPRAGIAASQGAYMAGAPCYISQDGTIKRSDTCDGTGDVFHGQLLAGQASELAVNTVVRITTLRPLDIYAVYVENNATDAAMSTGYIGDQYGLRVSTTAGQLGYTTMDINNANAAVQVVEAAYQVNEKFVSTDDPGVALVNFLNTVIQASKA